MKKVLGSWLALLLLLILALSVSQADSALTISAPDAVIMGEDIPVHATGLTKGDEVTLTLIDQNGRVLCAERVNAPGGEMDYTFEGHRIYSLQKGAGTWKTVVTTPTASVESQIQVSAGELDMPEIRLVSVSFSGSAGTAVIEVVSPADADQIYVYHDLHDQTGLSAKGFEEVLPLREGRATISADQGADYLWTAQISARVNGVWTPCSATVLLTGDHDSAYPQVTVTPDSQTDPTGMTVSAPGWNGSGCLIMFYDNQMLNYRYWSLIFMDGQAEARVPVRPQGTYRVMAGLYEDEKLVAWSDPIEVSFSSGNDSSVQMDYYLIDAATSGSMKAGEALTLDMSSGDGAEAFAVAVYSESDALIWNDRGASSPVTIPKWVFNAPGVYKIVCGIGDNYLERGLRVTIGENNHQPSAPTFGEELEEINGNRYVTINSPDSGWPDGWYYEIIRDSAEWSYAPSYTNDPYSSMNVRADTYGAGNYKVRACQVKNGVCGPWGYTTYAFGMNEEDRIVVEVEDSIPFGTDYTISTPTGITGSPVILSIIDKATGERVFWDVDQLNTRIFLMDGSFLAPGEYTAYISAGERPTGQKDFAITGDAPLKPELTADSLLLTGPGVITFTVRAPGAESAYLSEGGAATESYPVKDGLAVIQVEFSQYKSGTYEFRARAKVNGADSLWSDPVTITVRAELPEDHAWSEVTYEWAGDGSSVTASRYSLADETVREEETVAAGRAVHISPTETTEGLWVERSENFRNKAFTMQIRSMGAIPALKDMNVLYLPEGIKKVDQEALRGVSCQAVIIPEGCLEVGDYAFGENRELLYVRLPNSLISLAETAFDGCPNAVGEYN